MERLNVDEIAYRRTRLASDYSGIMKQLSQLKKGKAIKLIPLMAEHGSKAKAEVYYDATEEGQKEIELTYLSRGILEEIRSLKSQIDLINAEQYGQR